ncbi:TPA: GHKL domain-containing protein [Enterococcus faecalis]|nr:GHKL domain-containing protein [Enterococcus faecalis]
MFILPDFLFIPIKWMDWVVFKVKNKTNNEAKVSDFLKRGFSTKESNTGLGLYNIKKIEERNKNIHLNLKKSKNFFTAILTITSK